jgi:DNA adenine methylase
MNSNETEFKVHVPPIKTQGKKTKLVDWIKSVTDTFKKEDDYLFIEPFVGTGVVGFNIAPKDAFFFDMNPHLINFYNGIKNGEITSEKVREFLTEEGKKLALTSDGSDSYYYIVRTRFNKDHNPFDFLFLTRSCFNGMMRFNKKGGFNVPFCKKPERFAQSYVTKITNQVKWLENKIKNNNWKFEIKDFRKVLAKYKNKKNIVIYLDPPYINRSNDYFNGWKEKDEMDLYKELKKQKGQFVMSTWYGNKFRKNEYIDDLWSEFDILTKEHTYHVGANEANRNKMLEALIIKKN